MYEQDKRIVMTLDAGGTNFVFSAIRGTTEVVTPLTLPSQAHDLGLCLDNLTKGFEAVKAQLDEKPVAISFAFPGPADYPNGIIGGDLPNFKSFRDGVALGPFLQHKFGIPVYINNDGDLFAYGEALAGALPEVNEKLKNAGSKKQYRNLFGSTLGTGTGGGFVHGGELHIGDNSNGTEIYAIRNKIHRHCFAEESCCQRSVIGVYKELSGETDATLSPKDIFDIAEGTKPGDKHAALQSFELLGEALADLFANVITIIDGIIVIGGGVSGAHKFFMPKLIEEMNGRIAYITGETINRLPMKVYNLEEPAQVEAFLIDKSKKIPVYGTDLTVDYDCEKRIGIMISKLGASHAISLGAYCYALNQLDRNL